MLFVSYLERFSNRHNADLILGIFPMPPGACLAGRGVGPVHRRLRLPAQIGCFVGTHNQGLSAGQGHGHPFGPFGQQLGSAGLIPARFRSFEEDHDIAPRRRCALRKKASLLNLTGRAGYQVGLSGLCLSSATIKSRMSATKL